MQADLSLCWSHIPNCYKSHVAAHLCLRLFVLSIFKWPLKTGFTVVAIKYNFQCIYAFQVSWEIVKILGSAHRFLTSPSLAKNNA